MVPGLGLGPVFANEWLTTSRRWQTYAGRVLFVAVLLVGLASVWLGRTSAQGSPPIQAMAQIGQGFYYAIVFTQLTLVFLAAPAATAGAICQDKVNGTLAQMLVTDLSDAEIVLGKLAARLVPVIGLVCCALPVLALATLLGGIDPVAVTGVFLISVSAAIFGCTLAFTFSIWGTKPYEVLLAVYSFFAIWMLAVPVVEFLFRIWRYPPLPIWTVATNPYALALAPYERPGAFGLVHSVLLSVSLLLISSLLVFVAIARMRTEIVRSNDPPARRRSLRVLRGLHDRLSSWTVRGPSLDRNPVLWYEAHRQRPSAWIRTIIGLYFLLAITFTVLAIDDTLHGTPGLRGWFPSFVVAFQVAMSLPLVLVAATTALVEERARGSLDILLTTPISSRSIVLTKWWSVFSKSPRLVVLPALVAAVLASISGGWLMAGLLVLFILSASAFWTSIGLALSTWVKRLGRAMSIATALYAMINVAWPILAKTLLQNDWPLALGLARISAFHSTFDLTYSIENDNFINPGFNWLPIWIVVQSVVALGLLLATLATFDRSIGRIR